MQASSLSAAQQKALKDAVKLIADMIVDAVSAGKMYSESGVSGLIQDFSNVGTDVMVLVPEIGQFPSPASLGDADYMMLVTSLAEDLVLPSTIGNAAEIVAQIMNLLKDLSSVIVPDIISIAQSIKAK